MAAEESYPDELLYHREHDWVRLDGGEATFGVTWYAQDALGDLVVFNSPDVGAAIAADSEYGELESVKAVSGVIAPLAGEVLEVNAAVVDGPEVVNDDPYGKGWLVRVKLADPSAASALLSAADYRAYLSTL